MINELLFRGGKHLMWLWEWISIIGVTLLILALSPIILLLMGAMIVVGTLDYLIMGRRF
jgi:hypothetical protein